jgi:hypothetical protein
VSDDVLHGIGEDLDGGPSPGRRRSLWWLLALFLAAGAAAVSMVVFGGSGPTRIATPVPTFTGPIVTSHSPLIQNDITSTISVPTASTPPHAVNPFGTTVGAGGNVLAAVNALRLTHHLAPVTGDLSVAATACAQQQGRGSACQPHYILAEVPSQEAAVGVQRIQAFNSTWLLDSTTIRMEYGWSQRGDQFFLAILKWP